jgi:hypothetical protein
MKIKIHTPDPSPTLIAALEATYLKYTSAEDLFHLIWLGGDNYCGVFGGGANGSYEWFTWIKANLVTSDSGYGGTESALRDVLIKVS